MTRTSPWVWYGALLVAGAVLSTISHAFPAHLPVFLPWQFHWVEFLATFLILAWFWRGLQVLPKTRQPALWRKICFVVGVLSFYVVLQTRVDYYAQHMFFVHRWAHFVLHHAGAFLIALGMSGPVLFAGMPEFLKPLVKARPVQATLNVLQHPAVAPALFVGLLYFWLIPAIHTQVMLDENLYELMNWTMAINGVMFWSLVLDSRSKPPARLSHLMRALMILLIELPQMVLGAILSLSMTDFYPVYNICGRVLNMTALNDQHYGGLVIWLPGTLTSFAAMIVVLTTMRLNEERIERERAASI
ncbi:MAG TPA: cytochrome c oxidase assembly protein [Rhizomicrobium sp.]|nr:cytochrome c oxidase assembly protein [Rhizomicrobium sp.]